MHVEQREFLTSHLASAGPVIDVSEGGDVALVPAPVCAYRDLTRLRYDYPLVLVESGIGDGGIRPLSRIIDEVLQVVAEPGRAGEDVRNQTLAVERAIRTRVAGGAVATLSALWNEAASEIARRAGQSAGDNLARVCAALCLDGEVSDCNAETPVKVVSHLWSAGQRRKGHVFLTKIRKLVAELGDILRAERMSSADALTSERLRSSLGSVHAEDFDFAAMSRILAPTAAGSLAPDRRERIAWAVSVLRSQRLFADPDCGGEPLPHIFADGEAALAAYGDRLPAIMGLAKAIAVAELEIANRYSEAEHNRHLGQDDPRICGILDWTMLPSYLICLRLRPGDHAQRTAIVELLSSGLPFKVLAQVDDVLGEPPRGSGQPAFGTWSTQLAAMAVGLNDVYVVQTPASHLFQSQHRLLAGFAHHGPALFSIFSGAPDNGTPLNPYLLSAAAAESRAFPTFAYEPAEGTDRALRFHTGDNPQPDLDWPEHDFNYQDAECQRVNERIAVTFADFVACDPRYAGHFARITPAGSEPSLAPIHAHLAHPADAVPDGIPYLLMVDPDSVLHKVVVGDHVVRGARRVRDMWRTLQELGGIHGAHAQRAIERERLLQEQQAHADEPARPQAQPSAPEIEISAAPGAAEAPIDGPDPDAPYIETSRCTTCDECIQINSRLFTYDDNKQAYIADLAAGTYRDLVEAAESCQVCIIHPGKPSNPDEPGLEDLVKRAEPFL